MLAKRWKAVVLDVDGTMYSQPSVRRHMARRLAGFVLQHPVLGLRTVRCLRAFRQAQEQLRTQIGTRPVAQSQLEHAACRCGYSQDFLTEALVVLLFVDLPWLYKYFTPLASGLPVSAR